METALQSFRLRLRRERTRYNRRGKERAPKRPPKGANGPKCPQRAPKRPEARKRQGKASKAAAASAVHNASLQSGAWLGLAPETCRVPLAAGCHVHAASLAIKWLEQKRLAPTCTTTHKTQTCRTGQCQHVCMRKATGRATLSPTQLSMPARPQRGGLLQLTLPEAHPQVSGRPSVASLDLDGLGAAVSGVHLRRTTKRGARRTQS